MCMNNDVLPVHRMRCATWINKRHQEIINAMLNSNGHRITSCEDVANQLNIPVDRVIPVRNMVLCQYKYTEQMNRYIN